MTEPFMKRIEIGPHLDRWMMGDRFGTIVKRIKAKDPKSSAILHVKMDKSGKTIKIREDDDVQRYL